MRFKDFLKSQPDENQIEHISLLIAADLLPAGIIALESRWEQSGKKDWVFRVDAEDPKIPHMRHIHIAKERHKSAKNMQASWNEDGTRHDKKSFNSSVGNTQYVRDLARTVLGLGQNVTLESLSPSNCLLTEEIIFSEDTSEAYISIRHA